jgi:hypothetical protein
METNHLFKNILISCLVWLFLLSIFALPTRAQTVQVDLNNDTKIDMVDLGILLSNWNAITKPATDFNQDGKVDVTDFGILLGNWGKTASANDYLTLINADTDTDIRHLNAVDTIDFSALSTRNLNIRADFSQSGIGSVVFAVNGAQYRTESAAPSTLARDSGGDYCAWIPAAGHQTIAATAYSLTGGTGQTMAAVSTDLTVSDASPGPVCPNGSCEAGEDSANCPAGCPTTSTGRITGINFDFSTEYRKGLGADQWLLTWHSDGNLYGAWGDGNGWNGSLPDKCYLGITRITGSNAANLSGTELYCHKATSSPNRKPGGGIYSVGNTLYLFYKQKTDWSDRMAAVSTNNGGSWSFGTKVWDGQSDKAEQLGFVHFGPGHTNVPSHVDSSYIYGIFTDPTLNTDVIKPLYLARGLASAPTNKSNWQWFTGTNASGQAQWGSRSNAKKIVDDAATGNTAGISGPGWYHTIMTYNQPLSQYILTYFTDSQGNLQVLVGDRPWGPFTKIWNKDFKDSEHKFTIMVMPKFISSDGKTIWLAWSGHPTYDEVRFLRATLQVQP